ncbi:MAG: hypothetical protein ACRDPS_10520 [Nocardioides sp.]|uniref:hypothetical protein n=1 Tax=Nocardioides sp. TaxID=35761 RepID=UPI003D6A983A
MRFQRGPALAYAAVVLVGLLVLVQTLSPDVSSLHRVPRTLSGQAEFTVVPPAPTPDVSGVDTIPGTGDGADEKTDGDRAVKPAQPDEQGEPTPDEEPAAPAPSDTPEAPPSADPTTPADPGDDPGETAPPTLLPSVGPVPGIMAPMIWPFVSAEDSRPLDESVPMFLRQLIAAGADVPVKDLPVVEDETISAGEAPRPPQRRSDQRRSEPERSPEDKACEPGAEDTEEPETLPAPDDADQKSDETSEPRDEDDATPDCAEACVEPKSPVGSSPAAEGEDSADVPSEDETSGAPVEGEPRQDSEEEKTCAEESAH